MKGASDAGLQIPHSEKRFFGYTEEKGLDAKVLRDRIYLKSVADYMTRLRDNDEEAYKRQFSGYIAKGIRPEDIEGKVDACLKAIIANPLRASTGEKRAPDAHYKSRPARLSRAERKARIAAKLSAGAQ